VCTVLNGRVDHGPYQPAALTDAMRARGQALMCCAVALEDVDLEVEGVVTLSLGDAAAVPARWSATVRDMERLAPDLMRLHIALPEGQHLSFVAGQLLIRAACWMHAVACRDV
jgi:hypothetical protein